MMKLWVADPEKCVSELKTAGYGFSEDIEIADLALENTFVFTDRHEMERCTVPTSFPDGIDWNAVPYGDVEWNFAFNRHTFLLHLAHAYAATKDEKYRDGWIRLFSDFISNTSSEDEKSKTLCWRSLETGIRVENHLRSFEIINSINTLPSNIVSLLDDSLKKHIKRLIEARTAFQRLSNWGVLQDHGLFLASLYTGDEESLRIAVSRMEEETFLQIQPDGSSWEEASMYHAEVLRALLDSIMIAKRNGVVLPESILRNTEKLAVSLAQSLRPDRICYLSGDSDEIDMSDLLWKSAVIFSSSECAYFAPEKMPSELIWDGLAEASLPQPRKPAGGLSVCHPHTGNVYLRMDEDTALRLHAGTYGSGHGNMDQLHFDLFVKDKVILSDVGRYTYVPGEMRNLFKGSFAHNTIVIDGMEMGDPDNGAKKAAEAFLSAVVIKDEWSFIEGCSVAYAERGVFIRRRILSFGSDAIVIADELMGCGEHSATSYYHLDPSEKYRTEGNAVHAGSSLMIFKAGTELSISEFPFSRKYNEMETGEVLAFTRKFTSPRTDLLVIFPHGKGSASFFQPEKSLTGTVIPEENAAGVHISVNGREIDICFIRQEFRTGGYLIKAGEAEAYARVFFKEHGKETVRVR